MILISFRLSFFFFCNIHECLVIVSYFFISWQSNCIELSTKGKTVKKSFWSKNTAIHFTISISKSCAINGFICICLRMDRNENICWMWAVTYLYDLSIQISDWRSQMQMYRSAVGRCSGDFFLGCMISLEVSFVSYFRLFALHIRTTCRIPIKYSIIVWFATNFMLKKKNNFHFHLMMNQKTYVQQIYIRVMRIYFSSKKKKTDTISGIVRNRRMLQKLFGMHIRSSFNS